MLKILLQQYRPQQKFDELSAGAYNIAHSSHLSWGAPCCVKKQGREFKETTNLRRRLSVEG
jgi:hypothetical protein